MGMTASKGSRARSAEAVLPRAMSRAAGAAAWSWAAKARGMGACEVEVDDDQLVGVQLGDRAAQAPATLEQRREVLADRGVGLDGEDPTERGCVPAVQEPPARIPCPSPSECVGKEWGVRGT